MKRQRIVQNTLIIVLGIAIIFMSIGYAAYGTDFKIVGSTKIESTFWDVHFENTSSTTNTTVADTERITPPSINSNTTALSFAVSLKPGEVYELSTTVRNGGTYDSVLGDISLMGKKDTEDITSSGLEYQNQYIKYSVTYEDGKEINKGDRLDAGFYRKILIRVEYLKIEDENNIPDADENYTFNLNMNYTQV